MKKKLRLLGYVRHRLASMDGDFATCVGSCAADAKETTENNRESNAVRQDRAGLNK